MSELDAKINEHFPGYVVRKDLVKAVKGNAIGRNSSSTFHSSPGASFSEISGPIAQASSDENPAFQAKQPERSTRSCWSSTCNN